MEILALIAAPLLLIYLGAKLLDPYDPNRRAPNPPDRGDRAGTEP